MNFFRPESAAARYVRGRTFFHPLIIDRAKEFLSLGRPMERALDVGCGTGLSSIALKRLAARVVGVDASPAMLAHAPRAEGINYVLARAESLPFGVDVFELLTLSQVFHWLDPARFFAEARRVLRAGGFVVAYDNYLTGRMEGRGEFETWFRDRYKQKYPRPVPAWTSFDAAETAREGFRLVAHEWHQNTVRFTPATLADYLLSQSNVIAAIEGGTETAAQVKTWMLNGLAPIFGDETEAAFHFDAPVWFLQKDFRFWILDFGFWILDWCLLMLIRTLMTAPPLSMINDSAALINRQFSIQNPKSKIQNAMSVETSGSPRPLTL